MRKYAFIAALVLGFSLPAFANTDSAVEGDGDATEAVPVALGFKNCPKCMAAIMGGNISENRVKAKGTVDWLMSEKREGKEPELGNGTAVQESNKKGN